MIFPNDVIHSFGISYIQLVHGHCFFKITGSANSVELCKHLGLQRESHSRCTGHGYEVPSKKAHPESSPFIDMPYTSFLSSRVTMRGSTGKVSTLEAFTNVNALSPSWREGQSFFHSFTRFSRVDYTAGATHPCQQVDMRAAMTARQTTTLLLSQAAVVYCDLV